MVADRVRAAGVEVVQLTRDQPSPSMRATGITALRAATPADAVDVLGSCLAVVGVDTGMTHVAVQQGTPTVTLLRPRSVYFRPWPHCRAVIGDECDEACAAFERAYVYNDRVRLSDFDWSPRPCPSAGRCLDAIGTRGRVDGVGGRGMAAVMDSHPESDVFNSQPAGIGRVAVLGGLCVWNNLGRNIVFADRQMRLLAIHDETRFPDDDEPSQFDLDIHAIVEVPGTGVVVALNHLGWLRVFAVADIRSGGPMRHLQPVQTVELLDDIERLVVVGDRLVGSRPRREQAGGIVVSAPFGVARNGERLATEVRLEAFGEVTALAPWPDTVGEGLVVGGEGTVSTLPLVSGHPGRPSFHVEVGFRPMWAVWEQGLVWSAGPRPAADLDDYDWEQLGGGGFVGLDPADGTVVVRVRFR